MNPQQLPPRQQLAAPGKWPVVGEKAPRADASPWTVSVSGLVARPSVLTLADLQAMPHVSRVIDIHCVTRWSKPQVTFTGVPLADLLRLCDVQEGARYISFVARSERDHSTSLILADALRLDTLIAFTADGAPLATEHGGPVRTVTPGRYFYKSLKWLREIVLLEHDRLGYWEAHAGYHNHADPWQEERYIAPDVSPKVLETALCTRDLSGLDLRGLRAENRDLAGLRASDALLRDAHFEGANLTGADFAGANLSNAHFENANLAGANFRGADVEGAAFAGAHLQDADFTGASLFGATGLES